jgi:threonine/homoserine/homoserine lactone efflux protein
MNEIVRNIFLGLSLAAPLGPSSVAVIQNGLKWGFRRALMTGIGVTLADTTYLLVVFFGLSGFMGIPVVKVLVWSYGALVLLYLGVNSIREGGRQIDFDAYPRSAPASRNPLLVGYLINLSNPIAVVWWVGIFGSLLGSADPGDSRLAALLNSATILVGILLWHSTTALITHLGKSLLNERTARSISILAGIALVLFGIRFAYYAMLTILAGQ